MNLQMKSIEAIYKVNSTLFLNSFKKIDDKQARIRPNNKTNSMMFLALHILDARCYMLNRLGVKQKNPIGKYLDRAYSIEDIKVYPKLSRILSEWKKLDKGFAKTMENISDKNNKKKLGTQFLDDIKTLNMITFLAQHEAYHIGQLGFIRKYLGLPPVEY